MHRGLPTLVALVILTSGLGFWAWWVGRGGEAARGSAPGVIVARPIPAGGWGPMSVMTANIRLDQAQDGDNAWLKRREMLLRTVLQYQPEILACQEVSLVQGAYLNKELAGWYAYYPRAGVGRAGNRGGGGEATRSAASELLGMLGDTMASMNTVYYRGDRFDILDGEDGLVLPGELQANATENTFFSLAVLREKRAAGGAGGGTTDRPGTLIVVDVHFRHGEAFAIRCAARIREKIASWQAQYPHSGVVVLGDMNHDRTTALYAALTGKANAPDALMDLFDYGRMPAGTPWGTYHGFTGKTTQPWPTDLIFYGGTLRAVRSAEIVRNSAGGKYPTDHFLVVGEVE